MRHTALVSILVLAASSTFGAASAAPGNIEPIRRLHKRISDSFTDGKISPNYVKVPSWDSRLPSVSSVEDTFHRRYQEHKAALKQPILEKQAMLLRDAAGGGITKEQRAVLYEERRKMMAINFEGLKTSRSGDLPLFLDSINQLRHPTQAFPEDAGASLKLGQTWNFKSHGPYPALRLASLASHNSPLPILQKELANAEKAIELQTALEHGKGMYRSLAAFTDDLALLKATREYFATAYAHRDWRGSGLDELEMLADRTAKRLRL